LSLPAANGAPCRLVVPGRRGLDWVKWVSEIQVMSG
jgi:DMSO/TMAO reductase YedYZ molybdopterin-dependent catalytic subunit